MNRRDFLKSLLALPLIPNALKRAFGQETTGTVEVSGLGFEPKMVFLTWKGTDSDGYTTEPLRDDLWDIVSFDENGFTLKASSIVTFIPHK
jgi:hypothetical protein